MRSAILILLVIVAAASPPMASAAAQREAQSAVSDVDAAFAAVGEIDGDRLMRDEGYAAEMLPHLDRIAAVADELEVALAVDHLRLLALVTLRRGEEIASTIDRALSRRPSAPDIYPALIYAAQATGDRVRTVGIVETASRSVPGVQWGELRPVFDRQLMLPLLGLLSLENQEALRVRLAAALFRIGWPGDGIGGTADALRLILLKDSLRRGDTAAASEYASGVVTPGPTLGLIMRPQYDAIFSPGQDRLELLRRALAEYDRKTREGVERAPGDLQPALERAVHLRSVGRHEEAAALLEPFTQDVPTTAAAHEEGIWLINEAAYGLIALGRGEDAVALMQRLVAMPLAENGDLIGPSINFIDMLSATGRHAEALAHAERLEREGSEIANDYGKMWIASGAVCALARLGRNDEAAPYIERLRAHERINAAALTKAYLCLGNEDEAAALMIRRLERDDPGPAVAALQDYRLSRGPTESGGIYDRLAGLRDRPDVRTALGRVGRILSLPLARTYSGEF